MDRATVYMRGRVAAQRAVITRRGESRKVRAARISAEHREASARIFAAFGQRVNFAHA
jgi:hypothetical protein